MPSLVWNLLQRSVEWEDLARSVHTKYDRARSQSEYDLQSRGLWALWKEQRAGAVRHCLFQEVENLRWKTACQRDVR
jgi:hypothetical protein